MVSSRSSSFVAPAKALGHAQILYSTPPPLRGRKGGGCSGGLDNVARACVDGALRDSWCAARATPHPSLPLRGGGAACAFPCAFAGATEIRISIKPLCL